MGWNHRTSNKYYSPSEDEFLTGTRARKVKGLVTLSKICQKCNKIKNKATCGNNDWNMNNITYQEHDCSRSYNNFSKDMEVEVFKRSYIDGYCHKG